MVASYQSKADFLPLTSPRQVRSGLVVVKSSRISRFVSVAGLLDTGYISFDCDTGYISLDCDTGYVNLDCETGSGGRP